MRQLDYQRRVLETLDAYLEALKEKHSGAEKIEDLKAANPSLPIASIDYPHEAWKMMQEGGKLPASRAHIPFSPRLDGCGRHVPNVTLKVPTGGGKTYLAVHAVSKILGSYRERNTGFVLWIVPNEAIYTQTLKNLKNRDHPYRQVLDRASANRTKIMEKGDRLVRQDVDAHLCVMILMLQSSNRESKETLRMFRERGDVQGFFPAEGDQQAHGKMFEAVPNLDSYTGDFLPMIKDSLGNALRWIQPIVVMDEGQKATSKLAFETLYGFNPSFVLELTATPKDVTKKGEDPRYANLLVEVTGQELHREDMIKMPLNLDPRQGTDWKATLQSAIERQREIQQAASKLQAETGRYIRPIMLVQVERTGKDQRDGAMIHAMDVKERLEELGFQDAEIAIKTAEKNDLNQPENLDLLAPTNQVRVIITKAALQEGWDCPFAYVLCSLAANSNPSAMTQLVGRILRQPHATKTGVPLLDECHVITHHASTTEVVTAIKNGLEKDGLGDLVVSMDGETTTSTSLVRSIPRRHKFEKRKIYLPKVLWCDEDDVRELDYETDLLPRLDWREFDPAQVIDEIPENPIELSARHQRIDFSSDGITASEAEKAIGEDLQFDAAYATRVLYDLVPNPFIGRDIVARVETGLRERGFDDRKLGRCASVIVDRLRIRLSEAQAELAEALFKSDVKGGRIRFQLRLDRHNWPMPKATKTTQPEGAAVLTNHMGEPVENSLFAPMYRDELNNEERNVAIQLDGAKTLEWWHRNVAKSEYALQGWKRDRIYPDFIFCTQQENGRSKLIALETKGDHLDNPDTAYKRDVLNFLTQNFDWQDAESVGEISLEGHGETMHCELVLMKDISAKLPALL